MYKFKCQLGLICAVRLEGNPRALASRLPPVQTQNHTITCLLHQHAFAILCYILEFQGNEQ